MFERFQKNIDTRRVGLLAVGSLACVLVAGCVVEARPRAVVVAPAPVAVAPPPPVAVAPAPVVVAPEYYVWDGYEYVGWYNGAYVYWNGGVWVGCPEVVLGRFHGWARYHPDWRRGAVRWERGHREPHR